MNKFAISCGHNLQAKGMTTFNGLSEYDFNLHVCQEISKLSQIPWYIRAPFHEYNLQIDNLIKELRKDNINICMEFHLNAALSPAEGAEALIHYRSPKDSRIVVEDMLAEFCHRVGTHNRGVKGVRDIDRGFYFAQECKKYKIFSFIWEPAFCNWENLGSKFVLGQTNEYIAIMSELCVKYSSKFGTNWL